MEDLLRFHVAALEEPPIELDVAERWGARVAIAPLTRHRGTWRGQVDRVLAGRWSHGRAHPVPRICTSRSRRIVLTNSVTPAGGATFTDCRWLSMSKRFTGSSMITGMRNTRGGR